MADTIKEIAGLVDLKTLELKERWRRIYRAEPPVGISRDLLIRAAAYQIQEGKHGGLSGAAKRRLRAIAQKMGSGDSASFDFALCMAN